MMMRRRIDFRRQRGAVLAETAVVMPFLLFLVLLTAEATNVFVDHNTLTKSVRNGVRHLAGRAVLGTTGVVMITPQLVTESQNLVVYGNTAGAGAPVLPGFGTGDVQVLDVGGDNVQIEAVYNYSGILGTTLPAFGFGADADLTHTLRATVTMRAL